MTPAPDSRSQPATAPSPRGGRRLSDRVLSAVHQACDQNDIESARQLLYLCEQILLRNELATDANRRRSLDSLVAAHERLWHLRHPDAH